MQKKDAQPLSKDNLIDILAGKENVKNLCEEVKFKRK